MKTDDATPTFEQIPPGCTIAAATGGATSDGSPLLMSTSDDPFTTRTRLVVEQPKNGLRYIATQIVSPPPMVSWSNMHTRGLNEMGLCYTWSYVTPADEPTDATAIGVPYYQWGNFVLSQAARIDQVLSLLEQYPRAFHGNYLFADASGEICLVEVSTHSLRVVERTRDGVIGRTNHWTEGKSFEDEFIACDSRHRCDRVQQLLAEHAGGIDRDRFMEICRDHAGRDDPAICHSICSHGHDGQGEEWFGTVSSEIIDPRSGTLWYCYGWPCGEAPVAPQRQPLQDRSWGSYLPFRLRDIETGEYVTTEGWLTPRALSHLSSQLAAEIRVPA
jgi:hypothetical protein